MDTLGITLNIIFFLDNKYLKYITECQLIISYQDRQAVHGEIIYQLLHGAINKLSRRIKYDDICMIIYVISYICITLIYVNSNICYNFNLITKIYFLFDTKTYVP